MMEILKCQDDLGSVESGMDLTKEYGGLNREEKRGRRKGGREGGARKDRREGGMKRVGGEEGLDREEERKAGTVVWIPIILHSPESSNSP